MSFMPTAAVLAAAGAETVRELPMSPYVFGATSFGAFLVLLVVLWFFRNTAAKYDKPVRVRPGTGDPGARGSADPGAHH